MNKPLQPFWYRLLEKIWYHNHPLKYLLLPLSYLFCHGVTLRRKQYEKNQTQPLLPIIIVGNISVGGTGKTPFTLYLVKQLKQANYQPAIITRGYGSHTITNPILVTHQSTAKEVGDEALLLAQRAQVPVVVCPDRNKSIRYLTQKPIKHNTQPQVIISDDGLQHYKMGRTIEIVLVDTYRWFGNEYCLPAGPLREKTSRLKECQHIILTGNKQKASNTKLDHSLTKKTYKSALKAKEVIHLKTGLSLSIKQFIKQNSYKNIHAITGIGNPQQFYETLDQYKINSIEKHTFIDHYSYKIDDFNFLTNQDIIIMTEKDAVKCKSFNLSTLWYLPITIKLKHSERFMADLIQKLP